MIVLAHTGGDREDLLESRFHGGVGPGTRTRIGPLRHRSGREHDEQCERSSHYFTSGFTTRLRNSTARWSPCSVIGPGSASFGSLAIAVSPSTCCLTMIFFPFSVTLTCRPISRMSRVCHSPGGRLAFSVGRIR